jgi:hypothetical protein
MATLGGGIDAQQTNPSQNAANQASLAEDLKERLAKTALGGSEKSRQRHIDRGKLLPRDRIDYLLDDGQPLPGDRTASGQRNVPRRVSGGRGDRGDRTGARPSGAGYFQRRHRQGRHLLPDDGQEAPPGPGNRPGEPAALHLPGGFRRSVPAQAGRGLPGQGTFRQNLLQPGKDVRGQDSPDRIRSWAPVRQVAPTCPR